MGVTIMCIANDYTTNKYENNNYYGYNESLGGQFFKSFLK